VGALSSREAVRTSLRDREPHCRCHRPAWPGDPVRRGLSAQALLSLEYWITRFRGWWQRRFAGKWQRWKRTQRRSSGNKKAGARSSRRLR